jgi:hypothetical protein
MFLKEACTPRKSVFNKERRDVVLDLSDLLEGKVRTPYLVFSPQHHILQ